MPKVSTVVRLNPEELRAAVLEDFMHQVKSAKPGVNVVFDETAADVIRAYENVELSNIVRDYARRYVPGVGSAKIDYIREKDVIVGAIVEFNGKPEEK